MKKESGFIYILYKKSHIIATVKENKLKSKHVDPKKVKYILVPSIDTPNTFICIKPTYLLLADRFKAYIKIDSLLQDFEDDILYRITQTESSIDTKSVITFINYMSSLYIHYGFSSMIEETAIDASSIIAALIPTVYSIQFIDKDNSLIHEINSSSLSPIQYDAYFGDTDINIYEYLLTYYEPFEELLLKFDAKQNDSIQYIPKLIIVNTSLGTWEPSKKISYISLDTPVFYQLNHFGHYFLATTRFYNRLLTSDNFDISTCTLDLKDKFPIAVYHNIEGIVSNQNCSAQDIYRLINTEYINSHYFISTFPVTTPIDKLIWICFGDRFSMYFTILEFFKYEEEYNIDDFLTIFLLSNEDEPIFGCIDKDVLSGKLRNFIINSAFNEEE